MNNTAKTARWRVMNERATAGRNLREKDMVFIEVIFLFQSCQRIQADERSLFRHFGEAQLPLSTWRKAIGSFT
jgi:hypothetical protein